MSYFGGLPVVVVYRPVPVFVPVPVRVPVRVHVPIDLGPPVIIYACRPESPVRAPLSEYRAFQIVPHRKFN
ncbi:MAG: hypothetical protein Homavirus22_6 [Homavirus sp.]|uniref:Uncharacterized protein n=1 Tax=Homavirus sp. TaxID=2487769 RepID=A0A3G5AA97_9VIRU|nr:MAG: hypothetical protein Homavirus22_6 [Homavirus sp.]